MRPVGRRRVRRRDARRGRAGCARGWHPRARGSRSPQPHRQAARAGGIQHRYHRLEAGPRLAGDVPVGGQGAVRGQAPPACRPEAAGRSQRIAFPSPLARGGGPVAKLPGRMGGRNLAMTLEELPTGRILDATFFERDTRAVARDLLDKVLVRDLDGRLLWGRLVEVEAYLGPRDLAAHSRGGRRTARTEVMFGGPGHAYVYFTYGMYWCLNFVTREMGMPQAVLVRALEPGPGVGRCGGPGLVTRALSIDRALNGVPLRPPDLYVVDDGARKRRVFVTPRIGVQGTGLWEKRLLRYALHSPALSRPVRRKRVRTL